MNQTQIPALRRRFQRALEAIQQQHREGTNGHEVVRLITEALDEILIEHFRARVREVLDGEWDEKASELCLAAVGGYGRGHMNPHSDIDLCFIFPRRVAPREEKAVKALVQDLWDNRFDLGHACRTIDECVQVANSDTTVKTALSESRFLIGNRQTYLEFRKAFRSRVLDRRVGQFVNQKIEERRERFRKYGRTHCLQEPNLKESPGGLRDFHHALWLATARFDRRTLDEIVRGDIVSREQGRIVQDAIATIFRIRNELHFLCGKKVDVLSMDLQCRVAENLCYRENGPLPAYQPMMDEYYRAARIIRSFAGAIERRTQTGDKRFLGLFGWSAQSSRPARQEIDGSFVIQGGEIAAAGSETANPFAARPDLYPAIFDRMFEHRAVIHPDARQQMIEGLEGVRERLAALPSCGESFRRLLNRFEPVGDVVRAMHETGYLGVVVPPFDRIRHLVRHDLYHRYTVDEHSLRALEAVEDLVFARQQVMRSEAGLLQGSAEAVIRRQAIADMVQQMGRLDLLRWCVLCHDIGKGFGRDHHLRGADLSDAILARLGYPEDDRDLARSLIVHHQQLSHTAFRRDIEDSREVNRMADLIGARRRLDMLLLLTIADLSAVGGKVLNDWKWNLLWQLYSSVAAVLSGAGGEPEEERYEEAVGKILTDLQAEFTEAAIRAHLARLPHSYALYLPNDLIARHLRAIAAFEGTKAVVRAQYDPARALVDVDIVAPDRIGLFHDIARAFAPENFNIQSVRLYTRDDGLACDTFSASGKGLEEPHVDERLFLLTDRIQRNIARPQRFDLSSVEKLPAPAFADFENSVEVYNHISPTATVIDIRSVDRPGLLSVAAGVLSSLGLNIRLARIHTQHRRVVDAFYVTEPDGTKILDASRIEAIRSALLSHL